MSTNVNAKNTARILEDQGHVIEYLLGTISGLDLENQFCLQMSELRYCHAVQNTCAKETISSNSMLIKKLLKIISVLSCEPSWFSLITKCEDIANKRFMVPNVRLPNEICNLLGLGDAVCLGTMGNYKVIVDGRERKVETDGQRRIVLVLQCDIEHSQHRQRALDYLAGKYRPLFRRFGCSDIVCYSTSLNIGTFDIECAHKIHPSHAHWGLEATVKYARQI